MNVEAKIEKLGLELPNLEDLYRTNSSGAQLHLALPGAEPALSLRDHAAKGRPALLARGRRQGSQRSPRATRRRATPCS